jgi:hypothetical protein
MLCTHLQNTALSISKEKRMKQCSSTIPHVAKTTIADVVRWAHELARVHARIAPHFARPEPRRRALAYLQGILSETSRKNAWQLAEHAREATPYGMQRLLSQAVWDVGLIRNELRGYALEHLGMHDAILAIDETSFRHPLATTRLALASSIAARRGRFRTARWASF